VRAVHEAGSRGLFVEAGRHRLGLGRPQVAPRLRERIELRQSLPVHPLDRGQVTGQAEVLTGGEWRLGCFKAHVPVIGGAASHCDEERACEGRNYRNLFSSSVKKASESWSKSLSVSWMR
jgi:hypothetical protein